MKHLAWYLLALAAITGCGSVSPARGHDQVAALVKQRTSARTGWERGRPDDAQVGAWVQRIVGAGITRERAVQVALVNNPELLVTYEELGISQADMVQAGLLQNPTFGADLGFERSSGALAEVRLSLIQNLLDLLVLPTRKRIAREQFEADVLKATHKALEVAADAEKQVTAVEASAQLVEFRRMVLGASRAGASLAQKQREAGNINELEFANQRATYEQARLDLAREELQLLEGRERLNVLLGLWGQTTEWTLREQLPPLPPAEPDLQHLEAMAMKQRLDVDARRRQVALLSRVVDLARSTRFVGQVEIGVDAHRDPDGPRVLGPSLMLELPIFDQRQAYIARLEAQRRAEERRLGGLAIDVRAGVRLAQARLDTARQTVIHYRDVLLPLRQAVVEQTQLHYNGMFVGLYQLIDARQAEVDSQRGYLEALRDYWMARSDLRLVVGGRLPAPSPGSAVEPAAAAPAKKAAPKVPSSVEGAHHHAP